MLAQLLHLVRPLMVFDVETTSNDPETARICQFAFQLHKLDGSVVDYHTLVDPLVEIPRDSSEVHGITDEIIKYGCAKCREPQEMHIGGAHEHLKSCPEWRPIPTFKQLGPRLHQGMIGCDLSGYNVQFDINVTERHLDYECGLKLNLDGVNIIDPHRLWQVMEPRNLSAAYERFTGKKAENAHDAMADVRMTAEALIGQLQKWGEAPREVAKLHALLWPDRIDYEGKFVFNKHNEACFGFGKHKGKPMRLNIDYLKWMARQGGWSASVTRIVNEALQGRFPERKS
jgi:DNA polymerase-3 subunit epsilon